MVTYVNPANLRNDFLNILEKAGIPRIRFHDLRHTAASLMLNKDGPVITFSKRKDYIKSSMTIDMGTCIQRFRKWFPG